jgi:hypothetical protein
MLDILAVGTARLYTLLMLMFYDCEEVHVDAVIGTVWQIDDIHWTLAWVKVSLIFEHDL